MRIGVSAAIDRRFERLIVRWVRRKWPALQLVPGVWIRPAIAARAVRLRRSVARAAIAVALPAVVILAVLVLN